MRQTSVSHFLGLVLLANCTAQPETERTEIETEMIEIAVGDYVFDGRAAGPPDGDLVLLLHGFPQTSYEFRHQIPVLAQAGFRAVAPDQRGYSPRARPPGVEAYSMRYLVGDVIGIVDALEYQRFHLIGHDWGAAVAWVVATQYPGRVKTLTALSTPHVQAFVDAIADPNSDQGQRSAYFIDFSSEGAEERFLVDDAAFLRSLYSGSGATTEEIQVYLNALGTPEALGAALNWYRASGLAQSVGDEAGRSAAPAPPRMPPIQVPTLYVWSTADVAFSRDAAERTRDYVSGPYRFEVLEGVSHWVPEQAADRVSALLLEHLNASAD